QELKLLKEYNMTETDDYVVAFSGNKPVYVRRPRPQDSKGSKLTDYNWNVAYVPPKEEGKEEHKANSTVHTKDIIIVDSIEDTNTTIVFEGSGFSTHVTWK